MESWNDGTMANPASLIFLDSPVKPGNDDPTFWCASGGFMPGSGRQIGYVYEAFTFPLTDFAGHVKRNGLTLFLGLW